MKAQELRIGNYYLDINDRLSELGGWDLWQMCVKEDRGNLGVMEYQPIPLTEDWLLKFGFEQENEKESQSHGYFFSKHILDYKYCFAFAEFRKDWGFYIEYTDSPFEHDENKKYIVEVGFKHVHQLQNLYFALTNEELIIK